MRSASKKNSEGTAVSAERIRKLIDAKRPYVDLVMQFKRTGRVLDIGCGRGYLLRAFADQGFETAGYELNEDRCSFARDKLHLSNIYCEDFLTSTPRDRYDVIALFDVIEHAEDPMAFLQKVSGLLQRGGLCLISNMDSASINARIRGRYWRYIQPVPHLYYFSESTISKYFNVLGFKLRHTEIFPRHQWSAYPKQLYRDLKRYLLVSMALQKNAFARWMRRVWGERRYAFQAPAEVQRRLRHVNPTILSRSFNDTRLFIVQKMY